MSTKKVIIGMSGGVDSSVAAHLLIEEGYQVEGLFMKNWEQDDDEAYCASAQDLEDAQSVADKLGITLHKANFAKEYWDRVFDYFLDEYKAGRTPNPDILCNKEIKFKAFLDHAMALGADFIATGHYVRKDFHENQWRLLKGLDNNKDQSYFLYTLNQHQVGSSLFPIGEFEKPKIREIAKQLGLSTHDKKDSTGICFIGERRFKDFLQEYLPARPGVIETIEGRPIGKHDGLMYHTLGQRKGLGIGGIKTADEAPWYVVKKDIKRNVLIVGQGTDHPALFKSDLTATQLHWVSGEAPTQTSLTAKIRYRQQDEPCEITSLDGGTLTVHFKNPQRAITPGQSIVFYDDVICLGGGIIS